jgi:heparan-sulfate lyase
MKKMMLLFCVFCWTFHLSSYAQEQYFPLADKTAAANQLLSRIDLNAKGLDKVKEAVNAHNTTEAIQQLFLYYQHRTGVKQPELNMKKLKLSAFDRKIADESLQHTFYVHKGYQPSYNYGQDINWKYWPVHDNELRWQLHRHKWFKPLGLAWKITKDPKYAIAWKEHYLDWIQKNRLVDMTQINKKNKAKYAADIENMRFAWRQLEISNRLGDQTMQFMLQLDSPVFTPDFLVSFLNNYWLHAYHLCHHYSAEGNHLLFEAQRMIYAGCFFPEFKEAARWRKDAIAILNREIKKQVYTDGGQFELSPNYHKASIEIFLKAYRMAKANGFGTEFPQSYLATTEKMMEFYLNLVYPDGSTPCFSDAKSEKKDGTIKACQKWLKLFPQNQFLQNFLNDRSQISYTSKGFLNSGFFIFRNTWAINGGIQMDVKAGPPAFWHCQPDNGTFTLWYNGKNLFPDSGAFIYGGDASVMKLRNWFRQTQVHNTLTLENKNLEQTASVTKLWQPDGVTPMLVTENPSYAGLTHRRTIFFVEKRFFVILDEAYGTTQGKVNVHFNVAPGQTTLDKTTQTLFTEYSGNSNMVLKCFTPKSVQVETLEGWHSPGYRKRLKRTHVSFTQEKNIDPVRFVTVIYPQDKARNVPQIAVDFSQSYFSNQLDSAEVVVKVGKKNCYLSY